MIGAIVIVPLGTFEFRSVDPGRVTPTFWLTVLYIVAMPTVAAYYLNA
jgi:hypothetical protein